MIEVLIMKAYRRHVMPLALVALSACSENKLEVAGVDGGTPDVPGSSEPLRCEYQGKLYDNGQARPDDCSCFCDGKTGQFGCTLLLCKNDAGLDNFTPKEDAAPVERKTMRGQYIEYFEHWLFRECGSRTIYWIDPFTIYSTKNLDLIGQAQRRARPKVDAGLLGPSNGDALTVYAEIVGDVSPIAPNHENYEYSLKIVEVAAASEALPSDCGGASAVDGAASVTDGETSAVDGGTAAVDGAASAVDGGASAADGGADASLVSTETQVRCDCTPPVMPACGTSDVADKDYDNDGIPNCKDPDIDGDGIPNAEDCVPWVSMKDMQDCSKGDIATKDYDGDGIRNCEDPDIDGDGIPNICDSKPYGK
jgi:hypothetical protein